MFVVTHATRDPAACDLHARGDCHCDTACPFLNTATTAYCGAADLPAAERDGFALGDADAIAYYCAVLNRYASSDGNPRHRRPSDGEAEAMTYEVIEGDCLEVMRGIADASVDAVICDPPYGTTACKWDSVIPFAPMWERVKRVAKPRAAIVLFGSQPFTSALVMSNPDWFRYVWTWDKVNRVTGFLDAKRRPLRVVEDLCVFYRAQPTYHPQMEQGKPYRATSRGRKTDNYGAQHDGITTVNDGQYYPKNLLSLAADERGTVGRIHPTQKPIALMEYLIRTYTNESDTVLDFACGSGTTGVACVNTGRAFIGIENHPPYVAMARQRIREAAAQPPLAGVA